MIYAEGIFDSLGRTGANILVLLDSVSFSRYDKKNGGNSRVFLWVEPAHRTVFLNWSEDQFFIYRGGLNDEIYFHNGWCRFGDWKRH